MSPDLSEDFDIVNVHIDREKLIRMGAVNHIRDINVINGENALGVHIIADIQIFTDFFKAGHLGQVGLPFDIKEAIFQIGGIQAAAGRQKEGDQKNQLN